MKESYGEGVASHTDPESCVVDRKADGEALTGARAGRVWNREMKLPAARRVLRGAHAYPAERKATPAASLLRDVDGPRAVVDPVHVRKHPGGNREILGVSALRGRAGRIGKSQDARR